MKTGSSRRAASGLTLIELLVTIVVLGVIISLAAPLVDILEKRRLIAATEAVRAEMAMARTEAVKQSRDTYVTFSGSGTDNWCLGTNDLAPGEVAPTCDCTQTNPTAANACTLQVDDGSGDRVLKVLRADDFPDVSLATNRDPLQFDFVRGMTPNNGTISISSPKGYALDVVVARSGRVRVCQPASATRDAGGYPSCN